MSITKDIDLAKTYAHRAPKPLSESQLSSRQESIFAFLIFVLATLSVALYGLGRL